MSKKLVNGAVIAAFMGSLIFGCVWFWFMSTWAEVCCIACFALLPICLMFMEEE